MKKLKLVLLLAVALIPLNELWGQNCVRNIRTKHDSSQNNELAAFFPGKINPWLNSFDFAAIDNGTAFFDIQLNPTAGWVIPGLSGNGYLMKSPYSVAMPSEYDYLSQPFGAGSSVFDADIWWEDGWELMWINTGFFPNNEAINVANPNRILSGVYGLANPRTPYIILYNRYTGKLRVFANLFTDYNAYDHVRMKLSQPRGQGLNVSGIFRHLLNYDQTLDEPTRVYEISSTNKNHNNNTLWWSSDFQLGYDPCVCEKQSEIEFKFDAIKSYDLDLNGRIIQQNMDLSVLSDPEYGDFLSNESVGGANFENGGSLLFKRFDNLIDKYDTELDLYNTQLNSYNAPFNSVMRDVLKAAKDGLGTAGGAFVYKPMGDFFLRQLVKIDGATKKDTTQAKGWAEEVSKSVKGQLGKGFDFLTVAAFGDDFLEKPQRPAMPTATFGEMNIIGTLTDSGSVDVSYFMTPGSYKYPQQLSVYNYPAYNEAVGLYALLRKPVVKSFEKKTSSSNIISRDTVSMDTINPGLIVMTEEETRDVTQSNQLLLRVNEPLKYKLNRALDFDDEKTQLYVCFTVELENSHTTGDNCYTQHLTQNNDNFYLRDVIPVPNTTAYELYYETRWKKIEDIGEVLFEMNFDNGFQPVKTIETQFGIQQGNFVVTSRDSSECVNEEDAVFNIKKVKMKVVADMYFDQKSKNGLQNNTMQTFTYLLFDDDNAVNILSQTSDSSEVQRYKQEVLALNNEVIEPSDPFVVETIGNHIIVNAKKISLSGYVGAGSGYTATLQATEEITGLSSSTTLGPNIQFKTVSGFSPFGKNPETSQQDLLAFCNALDNGYRADVAASKKGVDETPETPTEKIDPIKSLVYPNPATNKFYVSISAKAETEYAFEVYDLTGRTLINEKVSGANHPKFEVDASRLVSGTYLLKVSSQDGKFSQTHRIVILK